MTRPSIRAKGTGCRSGLSRNRVQKFKSFVYGAVRWVEDAFVPILEVEMQARSNNRPVCSGCGHKRPRYDRLPERRFEFIPMWGKRCYAWFLACWAKHLSWKEVAEVFRTTWDHVFCSVERAVTWGRERQDLSGIKAIGVDEIAWQRGHRYLTLVYQIDEHCKRLLWTGEKRTIRTLLRFFCWFGKERSQALKFVCSDMWKPYLKVIARKADKAINILDRFHIIAHLNKAIDEVRAGEARELKEKGYEPILTKTR